MWTLFKPKLLLAFFMVIWIVLISASCLREILLAESLLMQKGGIYMIKSIIISKSQASVCMEERERERDPLRSTVLD